MDPCILILVNVERWAVTIPFLYPVAAFHLRDCCCEKAASNEYIQNNEKCIMKVK